MSFLGEIKNDILGPVRLNETPPQATMRKGGNVPKKDQFISTPKPAPESITATNAIPFLIQDSWGQSYQFTLQGEYYAEQIPQLKAALESFDGFLNLFHDGIRDPMSETPKYFEQPVKIHFVHPDHFERDLKAAGFKDRQIQNLNKSCGGFYSAKENTLWIVSASWQNPTRPIDITHVARHELMHHLDDILFPDQDWRVRFFSEKMTEPLKHHWREGLRRAGLTERDVVHYRQNIESLRELNGKEELSQEELKEKEKLDQEIQKFQSKMRISFSGMLYGATGTSLGAPKQNRWGVFLHEDIFQEYVAAGLEMACDPWQREILQRVNPNLLQALDTLINYRQEGISLAQAKVEFEQTFQEPWPQPPRQVASLEKFTKISKKIEFSLNKSSEEKKDFVIHTVRAGETLSEIVVGKYGLSWSDINPIAELNQIEDPDFIQVGQQINIPLADHK